MSSILIFNLFSHSYDFVTLITFLLNCDSVCHEIMNYTVVYQHMEKVEKHQATSYIRDVT